MGMLAELLVLYVGICCWVGGYGLVWASHQIRKIAVCACAGNAGNVSPHRRFRRKPLVSDPGMHHGTCVTHVPWCMSGSLTCDDGENVPGIPGACAPAILRIWQEAHGGIDWSIPPYPPLPLCWTMSRFARNFSHHNLIYQKDIFIKTSKLRSQ